MPIATPLVPVDYERCQVEKPTGQNAFTLGLGRKYARCAGKPVVVLTERDPGPDGQRGAMSVCRSCLNAFNDSDDQPAVDESRILSMSRVYVTFDVVATTPEEAIALMRPHLDAMGITGVNITSADPVKPSH